MCLAICVAAHKAYNFHNKEKSRMSRQRYFQAAVGWLIILFMAGCSVGTDEENISNSPDGNITKTDYNGNILNEDSNDWRIQNYFKNDVYIEPVYPNPTRNGIITLKMTFVANMPESGLYIYANNINHVGVILHESHSVSFGQTVFTLYLTQLSPSSSLTQIQGKQFRLRIYDGMGRLISFGDVDVSE